MVFVLMKEERKGNEGIQGKQYSQEKDSWIQGSNENEGWQTSSCSKEKKGAPSCERNNTIQRKGQKLNTFLKQLKLKKQKEFELAKQGQEFQGEFLSVKWYRSSQIKFGFAINKRLGKATLRNKIKRILREWCRLNKNKAISGLYLICLKKLPQAKLTQTLWSELDELFKRIAS